MRQLLAVFFATLLLVGLAGTDLTRGTGEPRVADRVGVPVSLDQLPIPVAGLIRTEFGDDVAQMILRVAADGGGRYVITWKAAGATIQTAYSPAGAVLWREVRLSGESAATQDDDEEADSEEENEDFEREITIDLVPEPAKATILKEAAGHKLLNVEMVVVDGQLLYDADWRVDGHEIAIGVTPDGEVVEREREEIEEEDNSDD